MKRENVKEKRRGENLKTEKNLFSLLTKSTINQRSKRKRKTRRTHENLSKYQDI